MFIGRHEELRILKNDLSGKRKSTILLYGRRRIGKTSLIREVVKDIKDVVVVYHEFHRVTLEKNIAEFSRSIAKAFNLPSLPVFDSIENAFSFISGMERKVIVILDEYSDLKESARKGEVDSYMRSVIDNMNDNVSIVLMGSLLKVMSELLDEDNPLFGRFSTSMKLSPLDYYDASEFFPGKTHYEQIELYSVFGGSPYVLSLLDGEKDLKENIEKTIIQLSGSVRSYIEAVISIEADRIPHGQTILSLIANGKKKYSELEDVIGRDASGVLNKELKKLMELELVERVQPINRNDRGKVFYEITDPLIRFYFTYIQPNPTLLMTNAGVFYDTFVGKSIKDFVSRRFECVCRQYFVNLVKKGYRNDIFAVGSYWYDDKVNRRNGEFDVALKTEEGYEIYDAKFVKVPFSEYEAEKERKQIASLALSVIRWGIISASGFEKKNDSYVQLSLEDLFKD